MTPPTVDEDAASLSREDGTREEQPLVDPDASLFSEWLSPFISTGPSAACDADAGTGVDALGNLDGISLGTKLQLKPSRGAPN